MRRLLTFECESACLGATLDAGSCPFGLLIVTGGTQTRIGSHRLFERLASALSEAGIHCFRFDRRGVGDSDGQDPGWRDSRPDIEAAITAFRETGVERIMGFGLCDGASALALHAPQLGLDGLILVNPWFVEAESGEPPAAAVKAHYRKQLTSFSGWKKIATGSVSLAKILKGLARIVARPPATLADELARSLSSAPMPATLILARGDATAIAAQAEWQSPRFAAVGSKARSPIFIESDSHTFARPGDFQALLKATIEALTNGQAAADASNSASAR